MKIITTELITKFKEYLINGEKSASTLDKYIRDVTRFMQWVQEKVIEKSVVLEYKQLLIESGYAPKSVNSILSSLNAFFDMNDWHDIKVKALKIQNQLYASKEKELTKAEYIRLLDAAKAKGNSRLYHLMQTICGTGIRISELEFITYEAVCSGKTSISCKGKFRQIFIPKKLCDILKKYAKEQGIKSGSLFVSRNGKPLDRSNVWSDLKKLCESAGVSKDKVFPHNFRHLFARTYYSLEKDIVRLADILGHSSINTTRIYTMETGDVHIRQINRLGLVVN